MDVSRPCADCGTILQKRPFDQNAVLCNPCKQQLISEVNTPGVDKAISVLFAVVLVALVWWVF